MSAGSRRHKVKIFTTNESQDEYGQPIQTDNNYFEVWAKVAPKSGTNSFIASQHTDKTTHEITTRYDPRINSNLTIEFKGRKLEIENILNIKEMDRDLILICKEF